MTRRPRRRKPTALRRAVYVFAVWALLHAGEVWEAASKRLAAPPVIAPADDLPVMPGGYYRLPPAVQGR